jgi:hypothetical protein
MKSFLEWSAEQFSMPEMENIAVEIEKIYNKRTNQQLDGIKLRKAMKSEEQRLLNNLSPEMVKKRFNDGLLAYGMGKSDWGGFELVKRIINSVY